MTRTLFLGGDRSGKSRLAEMYALQEAQKANLPLVYLATAQAFDEEMRERIELHQQTRSRLFQTTEEPLEVAAWLGRQTQPQVVLIDCLSLLLNNWLCTGRDVEPEALAFVQALADARHPWVIVSNEVGLGIVPADPLSREYRDRLGWMHQLIAAIADQVYFTIAGIPLDVKKWQANLFS